MTTPPDAAAPPPKKKSRWKKVLWITILTPLFAFVLFTLFAYNWSYSKGERSGILRKLSRKGWLCKTWEGELAMTSVPGVMPELWTFTIRKDSVAQLVTAEIGHQVAVHYGEHRGLWTACFGDTRYFVDSVRVIQ